MPVAGGEVETVVRDVGPVVRMAVADGWLYFASQWSAGDEAGTARANSGGLRRVAVGGGAVETLAATGADEVAFAGGAAWTLDFEGGYTGTLHLRRHDGPVARDVATCDASAGGWHAMLVSDDHVWFAGGGVLRRVPVAAQ